MAKVTPDDLGRNLDLALARHQLSFKIKSHNQENDDPDPLMDFFGITPSLKRENRQYWGRELGMCWQIIVTEVFKATRDDYKPPKKFDLDEPYDLQVGSYAIDTKYRIGSGDSGTLKKFKSYRPLLRGYGLTPIFLIVRQDNLLAAIKACLNGGWEIKTGKDTFDFIKELTEFDLYSYLEKKRCHFRF